MEPFKDQLAVVTGASRGIGRAIALNLARQGARLCLVGRDRQALESVGGKIGSTAPPVLMVEADLTRDDDIRKLHDVLDRGEYRVDILIHSAGAYGRGNIDEAPVGDLDELYRANVRGPYLLTQVLLPALKSQRGQIVFVNSTQGQQASANVGQYAATQHALKAIADSLRQEVNQDGVRVLSIFCGRTATPRMEKIYAMEQRPYRPEVLLQPDDVAEVVVNALGLPRTAEVTNINVRPLIKSY